MRRAPGIIALFAPFAILLLEAVQQRVHVQTIAHNKAQNGYAEKAVADGKGDVIDHGRIGLERLRNLLIAHRS